MSVFAPACWYPLDPQFGSVVDKEVDGDGSLPSRMESNPSRGYRSCALLLVRPGPSFYAPRHWLASQMPGLRVKDFGLLAPNRATSLPFSAKPFES